MANTFRGIVRGYQSDRLSGTAAILVEVAPGETTAVYAEWRAARQIAQDLGGRWVEVDLDGDQPMFYPIPEPAPTDQAGGEVTE